MTFRRTFILFFAAGLAAASQAPLFADIAGAWTGTLAVGAAKLRIVFTISAA